MRGQELMRTEKIRWLHTCAGETTFRIRPVFLFVLFWRAALQCQCEGWGSGWPFPRPPTVKIFFFLTFFFPSLHLQYLHSLCGLAIHRCVPGSLTFAHRSCTSLAARTGMLSLTSHLACRLLINLQWKQKENTILGLVGKVVKTQSEKSLWR